MKLRLISKILMCAAAIAVAALGSACAARPAPTTAVDASVVKLQKAGFVRVALYGMMTYQSAWKTADWAASLGTTSIPVKWIGQVFNGGMQNGGIIEQIHGGVSEDGKWLLSLYYSRTVANGGSIGNVVSYAVTLKNVPISASDNLSLAALFDEGGDVQKFVVDAAYNVSDGTVGTWKRDPIDIPAPGPGVDFNATKARLRIAFEIVPSQDISAGQGLAGPC